MSKVIELGKLILSNFKGIKKSILEPDSKGVFVYGDNGTGKTSLACGFRWLLFDKDSYDKKDFSIKAFDSDNNTIHNLEHTVEGHFLIDGKDLVLKKVYKERWTKKRGSLSEEHTGHTTKYYVDDVPTVKRDYENKIESIIDEETFKLLTSPTFFANLHWKDMRSILISMASDVSDSEVIASNDSLKGLTAILDGKSLDDRKKILAARRKKINEELEHIPSRINELNRILDEVNGDPEHIKKQIEMLESDLLLIKADDGNATSKSSILKLENEMLAIDYERRKSQNIEDEKARVASSGIKDLISDIDSSISHLNRQNIVLQDDIATKQSRISKREAMQRDLRIRYTAASKEEPPVIDVDCPTCNQPLPKERLNESIESFNLQKSKQLESINIKGKRLDDEIAQLNISIAEVDESIIKNTEIVDGKKQESTDLTVKLGDIPKSKEVAVDIEKVAIIDDKIKALKNKLQSTETPDTSEIDAKLSDYRIALAKIEAASGTEIRIQELKDEEKELAKEYGKLEQYLYLMEQFIVSKVNLMTDTINGMFKLAKFKLFDNQINGGINEVCEILYDGVPYSSGLNTGHQIIVGMDICSTLQKHHKVIAPCFVDNAESINPDLMPEMEGQVIRLILSPKDKILRMEAVK